MIIAPVIFLTIVTGIAGMRDVGEIGRVAGKAFGYFLVVSTFALVVGLVVANLVQPGAGMNIDPATLDPAAVNDYAGKAGEASIVKFLLDIVPTTMLSALTDGSILQVLLVAILFGISLALVGPAGEPVTRLLHSLSTVVFRLVSLLMRFAPVGAFGAMAFTIGKYGVGTLVSLGSLILTFYLTSALFVLVVLGSIARMNGFSILKLIRYLKAGYSFNLDGTNIYMTLAALFIAQATGIELGMGEQIALLAVAMLSSKGAAGVTGAGFITLAATLSIVPAVPVAGMALILGVDRFMSECRALTNFIGNAVATVVIARWEGAIDEQAFSDALAGRARIPVAPPAGGPVIAPPAGLRAGEQDPD
jgi:aerobic C4-dicarboxylate transport protein